MRSFGIGLALVAGLFSATAAEAASRKCETKDYAGPWLVTAGDAICTVGINAKGRITSKKQCFYGRTDRPISIKGELKISNGRPCAVDGNFRVKGGKDVLFDRYRVIAAGTDGMLIQGFLKNGKVVEGFTLNRMSPEAAQ